LIKTNVYTETLNIAEVAPALPHNTLAYSSGTVSWSKEDGFQSLLIFSKTEINFIPFDGLTYLGAYKLFNVAYRGLGSSVDVSSIDLSQGGYFYLFAFNGVASTEVYNRIPVSIFVPPPTAFDSILTEDGFDILTEDGQTIIQE
jgi:hypothetical protein